MSEHAMKRLESSSERYWRELEKAIRNGHQDPDLWLNPATDRVELRPGRERRFQP